MNFSKISLVFLVFALSSVARAFPILNPNQTAYPRASLADFSDLVPAPAGKKGFLTSRGEHFYWADGSRARFWGINVANTSLQESDKDIEAIVKNFRASGFNLIRLHHFDERGGIIDLEKDDSRQFDAAKWRKLDWWIAKARENGLYIYLDLLDYRRFKAGDGVANAEAIGRSAKPYAVFDRRLIELQKEYARKLLREHVNPFTGLSYADDPAIVMLEIYDENGLFMRRGLWRSMPEPYAANFGKLWNEFLRQKYGSSANLVRAWTSLESPKPLQIGENLELGTIEVPAMTWTPNQLKAEDKPFASSARKWDGARFAFDVHRKYFAEMKQFLRDNVGFKARLCATGRYDDLPDLASQSAELDFLGCNFYYDHPYWGGGLPQWKLPSYFHGRNPLSDMGEMSMAATLGLSRMRGVPFVVREWNYCWPNPRRAEGMLEAASFGAMHDIDAMILFVYETNPSARLGYFNVRSDPARWGMAAMGARIFLGNLVQKAKNRVVVPYSQVDLFTYEKYHQPLYNLGWTSAISNDFYLGEKYVAPKNTDLMVSPGRSANGILSGAPSLIYGRDLRSDGAGNRAKFPRWVANLKLNWRAGQPTNFAYNGYLHPLNATPDQPRAANFDLKALLQRGWSPIGENQGQNAAHGFWDSRSKTLGFSQLQREEVLGAALDALKLARNVKTDFRVAKTNVFRSDTGQWTRNATRGHFALDAPKVQISAGNLSGATGFYGGLSIKNGVSGALVAISLDGLPLVKSRRFVIKMGADTRNLDQQVTRDPRFLQQKNGQMMVRDVGRGPVSNQGRAMPRPMEIGRGKIPLLKIWQSGVNWELLVEGENRTFWCDAPGARVEICDGRGQARPFQVVELSEKVKLGNSPFYPREALAVRAR